MQKKKKHPYGYISIRDSRRKVNGQIVKAFRVHCIGANGEPLQHSEILNDVKAVKTHIRAMRKLFYNWENSTDVQQDMDICLPPWLDDQTKTQAFQKMMSKK